VGTMLTNNAHILFDFAAPVYTNLVHNKIILSTGIGDPSPLQAEINMYPNPAHDQLTLDVTTSISETANYKLTNLLGEIVYEKAVELNPGVNTLLLNVKNLDKGMYFLLLDMKEGRHTSKLIVE